jgi:hypothetical protein
MKREHFFLIAIMAVSMILSSLSLQVPGTIKGRIKPFNGALHAWAVSPTDTVSGVIQNGDFEIKNLKEGRYRVIVEGHLPYKTTTKLDVLVNSGSITDIGEIILDQ